jgi:hypothetical protein
MTLKKEIENTINKHSAECGSDTPDYILAQYLIQCLEAFDSAVMAREVWYGRTTEEATIPDNIEDSRAKGVG